MAKSVYCRGIFLDSLRKRMEIFSQGSCIGQFGTGRIPLPRNHPVRTFQYGHFRGLRQWFAHSFWNIRRGSEFTINIPSPVEIRILTQWNLIGCSITASTPVLLPRLILPPPWCHCGSIPARKNLRHVSKVLLFQFYYIF